MAVFWGIYVLRKTLHRDFEQYVKVWRSAQRALLAGTDRDFRLAFTVSGTSAGALIWRPPDGVVNEKSMEAVSLRSLICRQATTCIEVAAETLLAKWISARGVGYSVQMNIYDRAANYKEKSEPLQCARLGRLCRPTGWEREPGDCNYCLTFLRGVSPVFPKVAPVLRQPYGVCPLGR